MYPLLIRLLAPVILIITLIEAIKRQGGWKFLRQRCGFGYQSPGQNNYRYWIHCASVGEVNAALPLISHLRENGLAQQLLVTTNTPTGAQFLQAKFADIAHSYCPIDWPYAINRFLKCYRPTELWVMETEIWPNLYRISQKQGIKISILNGRLSKKTLNAPNWLKSAYRKTLTTVTQILAKSTADAERFIELGADPDKVFALGNLKYAQIKHLPNQPRSIQRNYVLLASSHADEEFQITQLWQDLKSRLQREEFLVIVPRHPKRMPEIKKQLEALDIRLAVASRQDPIDQETDVLLVDKIGELLRLYEHASVVIMGGSFAAKGGQNIIEPSAYERCILTGPDMSNFAAEMQTLLAAKAVIQCRDYPQLEQQLQRVLTQPDVAMQSGQHAKQTVAENADILQTYLTHLGQI